MSGSLADPGSEPPIGDDEPMARFVFRRELVRANGEVKPEVFMPHPYIDCSVTRHASLHEVDIWQRGQSVENQRKRGQPGIVLLGRADIKGLPVRGAGLDPVPDPTAENPQHANIRGWSSGKPNQKHQAQLLVKSAMYVPKP